jgi:hypothetical protein
METMFTKALTLFHEGSSTSIIVEFKDNSWG